MIVAIVDRPTVAVRGQTLLVRRFADQLLRRR